MTREAASARQPRSNGGRVSASPPRDGGFLRAAFFSVLLIGPGLPLPGHAIAGIPTGGTIELVESVPVETPFDDPRIRNTPEVWHEMIAEADSVIEIETFYVSVDTGGDLLTGIVSALEQAQGRGVAIRLLADAGFAGTYPDVLARVQSWPLADVRLLDARRLWGGVLHAKCMIIDHDDVFVGSQNWDWRSLAHVRELGIRIRDRSLASAIGAITAMDWRLGSPFGENPTGPAVPSTGSLPPPHVPGAFVFETSPGESTLIRVAASPPQALPPGIPWDEPLLVEMIDSASTTLCVQVLTFDPVDSHGYHGALECALKRAAARGVRVRVMLSNWNKRPGTLPHVRSLAATPGIEIRFSNLPQWSVGFIPYARVEHPKYAVADDGHCWIGTSNWTGEGFHGSRNISLIIAGGPLPSMARDYFERGWTSPFAEPADPCGDYQPPRISR